MNKVKQLLLSITVVVLMPACGDDEVVERMKPEPENQAPTSFRLLQPHNNSEVTSKTPVFNWEQATDPDGDMVTYDLYLDSEENPSTLIAKNLGKTSFGLLETLDFETQYYWRVVAKDGKGASTETSSRSLFIGAPVKLLKLYETTTENNPLNISYNNEQIAKFGEFFAGLKGMPTKLMRLKDPNNNLNRTYEYTEFGKQKSVFFSLSGGNNQWTFQYGDSQRIDSITRTYTFNDKSGEHITTYVAVFKYDDPVSVNPVVIEITEQESIYRLSLKWQGPNIVEILWEKDIVDGKGFQFEGLSKIAYDEHINPFHPVLSKQFGFSPFYVLGGAPSGIPNFGFFVFDWQSFNNIVSYEVFDNPSSSNPIEGYTKSYTYNESYYPVSATVQTIDQERSFQEFWKYQE